LFVTSFGVALIGVGAIVLFVPRRMSAAPASDGTPPIKQSAIRWLKDRKFRGLLCAGTLLALGTISDSFVFLVVQKRLDLGATAFPLLYVGTSLVTSLFAVSCGRLADRYGRTRILLAGYVVLAVLYATLLLPGSGGLAFAAAAVGLLGFYYAATDGVLTAMAAAVLPPSHTGSGLAVLATATNLARLTASVAFGFLWTRLSVNVATMSYLVALIVGIIAAVFLLRKLNPDASRPLLTPDH
jgi:predicted MFS family arabinose efflux permease